MTSDTALLHYGIVRAAGQDIAIAASELVEAVDMPPQLMPMPGASALMAGMFMLRGQLIPVLELQRLMAPPGPALTVADGPAAAVGAGSAGPAAARQVAVVAHGGMRLGLGVDAIAEVLRVLPAAIIPLAGAPGGPFDRWLVADGPGGRALPVLQVAALLERTPGVVPAREPAAAGLMASAGGVDGQARPLAAPRRHTLAMLGAQVLAFDFADVPDVRPMPEMRPFFAASGALLGLVAWRGHDVPVADLQRLLDLPAAAPATSAGPRPLLMVLQREGRLLGLQVDALLGMEMAATDAIVPLGAGASLHPECYAGALRTAQHGIAAVLRVDALLAHPLVASFLEGQLSAAARKAPQAVSPTSPSPVQAAGARTTFLVYQAGGGCATPLAEVEEILAYPSPAVRIDAAGSGMCGLVECKGRPLEVFDLRTLLGLPEAEATPQARVLVVRRGERLRGFLVDSLVSLVTADAAAQIGREPAAGGSRAGGSGLGRMLVVGQGAGATTCRQVDLGRFMGHFDTF